MHFNLIDYHHFFFEFIGTFYMDRLLLPCLLMKLRAAVNQNLMHVACLLDKLQMNVQKADFFVRWVVLDI